MNYTEWSHRCCLLPFDLQCWLEKIWHQRQSFLPDKGPYFKNLCMYRSDTTCSWSKQVRASCGWVGDIAAPCRVPYRPAHCCTHRSYRHIVPEIVPARRVLLYDGRTARCRTRDAGDVWAAEETAGSRRHTHGGI